MVTVVLGILFILKVPEDIGPETFFSSSSSLLRAQGTLLTTLYSGYFRFFFFFFIEKFASFYRTLEICETI